MIAFDTYYIFNIKLSETKKNVTYLGVWREISLNKYKSATIKSILIEEKLLKTEIKNRT